MGTMVSSQYKPDRMISTDSRIRCAADLMLAAEEAGVVFTLDCKACERGDVPIVGADPATLNTEIRKHREEIASLTMLAETGSMASIDRMLTGRPR